jgi:ATP-dependent Zn protease
VSAQQPQPVIDYASPGAAPPANRPGRHLFGWVLFIGLAIMLFLVLQSNKRSATDITLSDFRSQLMSGNVAEVVIDGETIRGKLKTSVPIGPNASMSFFRCELPEGTSQSWPFIQWLLEQGPSVRVENNQNLLVNRLLPLVPWFLIFAFVWFFILRPLSKRSHLPPKPTPVYIVNPENK